MDSHVTRRTQIWELIEAGAHKEFEKIRATGQDQSTAATMAMVAAVKIMDAFGSQDRYELELTALLHDLRGALH